MSKKGLALTLAAFLLWAVAVPAFGAVDPFPDVPQDHWAYEAIESLRQAGLIEGYPDGTFGGERTFTRYEMAMVFSRILERLMAWLEGQEALLISAATGEVLAKLAEEFAPELEQLGVSQADLSQILMAMNNRIAALDEQVAVLVAAAEEAQSAAEAAAEAAARAENRAYRARLAAENARAQAMEANSVANRALAIALTSAGIDEATAESLLAEESVEAVMDAVRSATGADGELALAEAERASERAYRARLAAEQARALAVEAREIAERGLAIAEMAYASEDVQNAVETAEQAANRAYRARLAAEDARAQAREARELAERALAIAEMAGPGALDAAIEASEAVMEARQAAQRAQRMASDAETAAMIADAKADLARKEASESLVVAREAYQLASDAMNEAIRQGELARAEAREAMELARQADRLAFLAHLSAERALRRTDELQEQVDELRLRPVLGGEIRADFEKTHTSDKDDKDNGVLLDPRDSESDKIVDASKFTTSVALNATVEPVEDVVVQGGIELTSDVFGSSLQPSNDQFRLSDMFVKVTTPGVLRTIYFGAVTGEQLSEGFSPLVLDADRYADEVDEPHRGGAVIETEMGNLSSRIIASRTDKEAPHLFGLTSTARLADGMNVRFNYAYKGEADRATALSIFGETGGLAYDWTYALFRDAVGIDGTLAATMGKLELGFDYYSIDKAFDAGNDDDDNDDKWQFARQFTLEDDGKEVNRTAYTLDAKLPLSLATAVFEKGYDASLENPDGDFTDYVLAGLEDVSIFGFSLAGHYYADQRDNDRTTRASRIDVERTVEIGLPLKFNFTTASAELKDWDNPALGSEQVSWTTRRYQSIGVGVEDYALTDTLTLNAGYKTETNPLAGDWKEPTEWVLELKDDNDANEKFIVDRRDTVNTSVSLAATDALTLTVSYERALHQTTHDKLDEVDVVKNTMELGADYKLTLYGADVTLGYAYQSQAYVGPDEFEHEASPRTTYSVSFSRALLGGTVDGSYKLVTGRGSDGAGKVDARDVMASLAYTYPIAEDFDFTLSGKWGSSANNADPDDDYYYASVKAGVGLKF